MTTRKTPRLAVWGEYVSRDAENSDEVYRARLLLMEAVRRVYPRFLRTLSTEVFPLFRDLAKDGKLAKEGYDFKKALWSDNPQASAYGVLTEDGGLKLALSGWAAEFNAEVGWLMDGALRTLQGWYAFPDWRKSLKWDTLHGRSETTAIGQPFEFRYQGWDVRLLTWSAYAESIRERFEEKLSEYEKKTREFAESEGLVRGRRKYSPDNLEWFVLYQFAGMSSREIVNR